MAETKRPIAERIAEATAKVEAAKARVIDAAAKMSEANREECAAHNEMNAATRAFDALVKEFHESAPRGVDWHTERFRTSGRCEAPAPGGPHA